MAVVTNNISTGGLTITVSNPPETPTSPGQPGTFAWDESFIYVCVAENLWSRSGHSIAW